MADLEFLYKYYNFQSYEGGFICHHTSAENLISILATKKLYMTKYNSMRNDLTEGNFVLNLYKKALNNIFNDNMIDEQCHNSLQNVQLKSDRLFFDEGKRIDCTPYIACFSQTSDCMTMSQYSGINGGCIKIPYEIGFFNEKSTINSSVDNTGLLVLFKVIYGNDDIVKKFEEMILELNEKFKNKFDIISKEISQYLSYIRFFIKSPKDDFNYDSE